MQNIENKRKLTAKIFEGQKISPLIAISNEAKKRTDVINISLGEPDVPTSAAIVDAARYDAERKCGYSPSRGIKELRDAIRKFTCVKNTPLDEEQIIVTAGVTQASHLALQSVLDPGDEVMLLEPYFPLYANQVNLLGHRINSVVCKPQNDFLPSEADLQAAVTHLTKAIILNSPCNPSGAVYDRSTSEMLARFALEHDLVVISDELYEPFVFEGEHIAFASLPGMAERTVTMGGFSKSYSMCGWRVGYAMGPHEIISAMEMLAAAQTLSVNTLAQRAAVHALEHGETILKEMKDLFKSRTTCAANAVNAVKGLSCTAPKGGFYVFIDISGTGLDGETFAWRMLDEASVALAPGIAFGEAFAHYVRIACTVPEEKIIEAFGRVDSAINK